MIIQVTAEDIANGEANNCWRCPVAIAVNRAMPGCIASVTEFYVAFYPVDSTFRKIWEFTPDVRRFVNAYDSGQPVQPFHFEIPDRVINGG